jgi:hypothetical protein
MSTCIPCEMNMFRYTCADVYTYIYTYIHTLRSVKGSELRHTLLYVIKNGCRLVVSGDVVADPEAGSIEEYGISPPSRSDSNDQKQWSAVVG